MIGAHSIIGRGSAEAASLPDDKNKVRRTDEARARMLPAAVFVFLALMLSIPFLWSRFLGNVPIRYYGRVVDSAGNGISGASVAAEVTSEDLLQVPMLWVNSKRTRRVLSVVTDSRGNFSVEGQSGTALDIKDVTKAGWELKDLGSGMRRGFSYPSNPALPDPPTDPGRPYVYVMVPAGATEKAWEAKKSGYQRGQAGYGTPATEPDVSIKEDRRR